MDSSRATWGVGAALGVVAMGVSIWGLDLRGEPFFPGIYTVDAFSQILNAACLFSRTPSPQ